MNELILSVGYLLLEGSILFKLALQKGCLIYVYIRLFIKEYRDNQFFWFSFYWNIFKFDNMGLMSLYVKNECLFFYQNKCVNLNMQILNF